MNALSFASLAYLLCCFELVCAVSSNPRAPVKGTRLYLRGEFLYWIASEGGLDYSFQAQGQPHTVPLSKATVSELTTEWNTGFRVGLGYRLPHDQWDICLIVTRFRTSGTSTHEAKGNAFIEIPLIQLTNDPLSFHSDRWHWILKYHLFDAECARSFIVSHTLTVRPFFGMREASIHQDMDMTYIKEPLALKWETESDYEGWGLRIGSELEYALSRYFSFFGHSSFSLLWGPFHTTMKAFTETTPSSSAVNIDAKKHPDRLRTAIDMRGGAKTTFPLYRRQAYFSFALTYDMSLWFSQNPLFDVVQSDTTFQTHPRSGNLMLQGLSTSLRLDF